MQKLVVNADDLGLCRGVNEAVNRAHRDGILTSASLMATGLCFEHAVETVVSGNPELGIGAHLCLTSGKSLLGYGAIPALVNPEGSFRHGFVSLLRLVNTGGRHALDQIDREFDAQLTRIHSAGIAIDHVNSHRHIHMIPQILNTVVRLSARFGQPFIRISTEPWRLRANQISPGRLPHLVGNVSKNLILRTLYSACGNRLRCPHVDQVYGILGSGRMDANAMEATILNLPRGTSEILTHPALDLNEPLDGISPGDRVFVRSEERQRELDALLHATSRAAIARAQVQLTSFRDLLTRKTASI